MAEKTKIVLIKGGPMVICGNFTVKKPDGSMLELTPVEQQRGIAICRCGRSGNQPLCDGSHAK